MDAYTGALNNTLTGDNLDKGTELVFKVFDALVDLWYTVVYFMVNFLTQPSVLGIVATVAILTAIAVAGYRKIKSKAKMPGRG